MSGQIPRKDTTIKTDHKEIEINRPITGNSYWISNKKPPNKIKSSRPDGITSEFYQILKNQALNQALPKKLIEEGALLTHLLGPALL